MGLSWGTALIPLRKTLMLAPLLALAACGEPSADATEAEEKSQDSVPSLGPQLASAPPMPVTALMEPVAIQQDEPIPITDGYLIDWIVATAGEDALYRAGQIDLDDDGYNDALIYIGGRNWCGTGGCNLHMLRVTPAGIESLGRTTITWLPIGVLDSSSNGMRDIVVRVGGGGNENPGLRVLRFDGEKYPSNPTMPPTEPVDEIESIVIDQGDLRPIVY